MNGTIASLLDAIDFIRSCYSSLFALKIFVLFIVEQYVKNERDKTVVDLDRDEFVPKEKRE